jgi:hypothetical protein
LLEYYKHDAVFEQEMERIQNAHDLAEKPVFTKTEAGVTVVFPAVLFQIRLKEKCPL